MSDNDYHQIPHPETGELLNLRRVTSFSDVLDKYSLRQWQMKTVALAVATNQDIAALASMWDTCKEAVDQAFARKPQANLGTAGHKAAELLDAGEAEVDDFLHPDVHDMAARYERLMKDYPIAPLMSERRVYNLTVGYAGHFDRIWEVIEDFELHGWTFTKGELVVGDMKTGSFLDNEICLQQAAYVNAEGIFQEGDPAVFEEMPPVRKDVAFIVHVPQGKDHADLIPIRLDGAWMAFCGLSLVHEWKKVKLKIPTELRRLQVRKVGAAAIPVKEAPSSNETDFFDSPATSKPSAAKEETTTDSSSPPTTSTTGEPSSATSRRSPGKPPNDPPPATTTPQPVPAASRKRRPPDLDADSPLVDDAAYAALEARFNALDGAGLRLFKDLARQAKDAGTPISVAQKRTVRRWSIARALIAFAEGGFDEGVVRAACLMLYPDGGPGLASTTGQWIGALDAGEANKLADIAAALGSELTLIIGANGYRIERAA